MTDHRPAPSPDAARHQRLARRIAIASVWTSATLAIVNLAVGVVAGSTSVVAAGFEALGDVLAASVVLTGLSFAARPADAEHPYGHGRVETLAGLGVGLLLILGGAGIAYRSLAVADATTGPPGRAAIWALVFVIAVRSTMAVIKFRAGRRSGSTSLVADAWNDSVDIVGAAAALAAVGLARLDPTRFLAADHYGGFAVGVIVVITGVRVVRDASMDLMDTMPDPALTEHLRAVALAVPGVKAVEKQRARKTGLQYHVDLHIEVDPEMTVRASHEIAHDVAARIRAELAWVADVLVHIEPAPGGLTRSS
jgi:cation diffusion facilitator family transporter